MSVLGINLSPSGPYRCPVSPAADFKQDEDVQEKEDFSQDSPGKAEALAFLRHFPGRFCLPLLRELPNLIGATPTRQCLLVSGCLFT